MPANCPTTYFGFSASCLQLLSPMQRVRLGQSLIRGIAVQSAPGILRSSGMAPSEENCRSIQTIPLVLLRELKTMANCTVYHASGWDGVGTPPSATLEQITQSVQELNLSCHECEIRSVQGTDATESMLLCGASNFGSRGRLVMFYGMAMDSKFTIVRPVDGEVQLSSIHQYAALDKCSS